MHIYSTYYLPPGHYNGLRARRSKRISGVQIGDWLAGRRRRHDPRGVPARLVARCGFHVWLCRMSHVALGRDACSASLVSPSSLLLLPPPFPFSPPRLCHHNAFAPEHTADSVLISSYLVPSRPSIPYPISHLALLTCNICQPWPRPSLPSTCVPPPSVLTTGDEPHVRAKGAQEHGAAATVRHPL